MANRALILANGTFSDSSIPKLMSPVADAKRLATLLERSDIGDYNVSTGCDFDSKTAIRTIEDFFRETESDDLTLVLISGHGLKDQNGKLFFATSDTEKDRLWSTAIALSTILEVMDNSRAAQRILFVDTCYSGAALKGTTHKRGERAVSRDDFIENTSKSGRAVITATTAYQLAGEAEANGMVQSRFTKYLIEGIETGAAAKTDSEQITLDGLFSFIHKSLRDENSGQTPEPHYDRLDPSTMIAKNPAYRPLTLPKMLREKISSSEKAVRGAAVEDLFDLAKEGSEKSPLAISALASMSKDDSIFVRRMVSDALEKLPRESYPIPPVDGEFGFPVAPQVQEAPPATSRTEGPNLRFWGRLFEGARHFLFPVTLAGLTVGLVGMWFFGPGQTGNVIEPPTPPSKDIIVQETLNKINGRWLQSNIDRNECANQKSRLVIVFASSGNKLSVNGQPANPATSSFKEGWIATQDGLFSVSSAKVLVTDVRSSGVAPMELIRCP